MDPKPKKVMRAFRIEEKLNKDLKACARAASQSETRIVEDALWDYLSHFADKAQEQLKRRLAGLEKKKGKGSFPMIADARFLVPA